MYPLKQNTASDKEMNNTGKSSQGKSSEICSVWEKAKFRMRARAHKASQVKKCRRNALQLKPKALRLNLPLRDNVSLPTALMTLTYAYKIRNEQESFKYVCLVSRERVHVGTNLKTCPFPGSSLA